MGYTSDLTAGLAQLLDDENIGAYRPNGPPFTSADTAIVLGNMPSSPDRVICLNPYPVEDTGLSNAITAVQFRFRAGADPAAVLDMADAVFDALDNREHFTLGTVPVDLAWRFSQLPWGADTLGREELTANYYLRTIRAATYAYE
ncbi:minor capsid protein [Streptomyces sp. NPDC046977]|uniref:minor capsid protein n=1 Tax=Streptomyces sp. NPDC046977 TaxID=3154703 RepID=UPI0033ED6982